MTVTLASPRRSQKVALRPRERTQTIIRAASSVVAPQPFNSQALTCNAQTVLASLRPP